MPSTTNNGLLLERTEDVPLIRIAIPEPGSPLAWLICTPAAFPCISCSGDAMTPPLKSFAETVVTAPVASFTVVVP
mgnify:CR=1 FL=1